MINGWMERKRVTRNDYDGKRARFERAGRLKLHRNLIWTGSETSYICNKTIFHSPSWIRRHSKAYRIIQILPHPARKENYRTCCPMPGMPPPDCVRGALIVWSMDSTRHVASVAEMSAFCRQIRDQTTEIRDQTTNTRDQTTQLPYLLDERGLPDAREHVVAHVLHEDVHASPLLACRDTGTLAGK